MAVAMAALGSGCEQRVRSFVDGDGGAGAAGGGAGGGSGTAVGGGGAGSSATGGGATGGGAAGGGATGGGAAGGGATGGGEAGGAAAGGGGGGDAGGGGGTPVECSPDEVRCAGDRIEVCGSDGRWGLAGCAGWCGAGRCILPPSCRLGETGAGETCGPDRNQPCCASPRVPGGLYDRSNDEAYPAEVSDLRLDRYEVTVGRFRKFVEAYPASRPAAGAGAHPAIVRSGWDAAWDSRLPASQAALREGLKCNPGLHSWTDEAGGNELKPISCVSWFVAFAFCAWDGGRLPTEAEWDYASAGGSEQRAYPWGNALPNSTYAVFDMTGSAVVGSRSPRGDGRWGQADLAGNMWEWTLDFEGTYPQPCRDCANVERGAARVIRGGSWWQPRPQDLSARLRTGWDPTDVTDALGVRCARKL
ncbi:SUMF1/EgtB/PvdO family nonheme iron enzyme [Sorangium sp. So ce448]|uniref:formylglycine-generating enzyme family protein n=1 Tax=Sorangium sp. So ce448 TaxID=3133314 RepID=UPI003F5EBF7C